MQPKADELFGNRCDSQLKFTTHRQLIKTLDQFQLLNHKNEASKRNFYRKEKESTSRIKYSADVSGLLADRTYVSHAHFIRLHSNTCFNSTLIQGKPAPPADYILQTTRNIFILPKERKERSEI